MKRSTIALGGEAGNTHYDSVSHCILVAVQTKNQMVAIDPVSERIVQRYDLPGSDHPHGFDLDQEGRFAFVTGEGNASLLVVDLRTMKVIQTLKVADGPDVLAWDAAWHRLYVAAESGVLAAFWLDGRTLRPIAESARLTPTPSRSIHGRISCISRSRTWTVTRSFASSSRRGEAFCASF